MAEKTSEKPTEKNKKAKKLSEKEFEKKVIELADSGLTSEKIGLALKNQGIHPKEYQTKISKILKKAGKYVNPDLKNVQEKLDKIKKQYEENKQDKKAMREKDRVFSQLRKLKKHFGVAIK